MLNIPLLLIGTAEDGPSEELVLVQDEQKLLRLFGGYRYEQTTLTSGSTGFTLATAPWGDEVRPLRYDGDGALIDKFIPEFRTNGTALTFSAPGASLSGTTVLRYQPIPGSSSLITGWYAARSAGVPMWLMRLGGTVASATSGQHTIQSVYGGTRYNGTSVVVGTGSIAITPATGTGLQAITYSATNDVELVRLLNIGRARGHHNITIVGPLSPTSVSVTTGTWTLTGAANGTMTVSGVEELLESYGFDGVDVVVPLGLTLDAATGSTFLAELESSTYPTLMVVQSSTGSTITGTSHTSKYICSAGFLVVQRRNTAFQVTGHAAATLGSIIASRPFQATNAPLTEYPATPRYNASQLATATASGHTLWYQSIRSGPAIYRAVTGDQDWSVSTIRSYQEVVRVARNAVDHLVGTTYYDDGRVRAALQEGLQRVRHSTIHDWTLEILGDTVYLQVAFTPYWEVRAVSCSVKLGNLA